MNGMEKAEKWLPSGATEIKKGTLVRKSWLTSIPFARKPLEHRQREPCMGSRWLGIYLETTSFCESFSAMPFTLSSIALPLRILRLPSVDDSTILPSGFVRPA